MTTVEFDHLFICTTAQAPEAEALIQFGLQEGSGNTHPGQGTANRRFFFRNAMVELLWITDPDEAQSDLTRPLHLWERWSQRQQGACSLGIGFRPTGPESTPPFSTWIYRPLYLPESLTISIAQSSTLIREPLLFFLPFGERPDRLPLDRQQPLDHRCGLQEITRVTLLLPAPEALSADLQSVVDSGLIGICRGPKFGFDLGFDGEVQGQSIDFRPTLPLIFRW